MQYYCLAALEFVVSSPRVDLGPMELCALEEKLGILDDVTCRRNARAGRDGSITLGTVLTRIVLTSTVEERHDFAETDRNDGQTRRGGSFAARRTTTEIGVEVGE